MYSLNMNQHELVQGAKKVLKFYSLPLVWAYSMVVSHSAKVTSTSLKYFLVSCIDYTVLRL